MSGQKKFFEDSQDDLISDVSNEQVNSLNDIVIEESSGSLLIDDSDDFQNLSRLVNSKELTVISDSDEEDEESDFFKMPKAQSKQSKGVQRILDDSDSEVEEFDDTQEDDKENSQTIFDVLGNIQKCPETDSKNSSSNVNEIKDESTSSQRPDSAIEIHNTTVDDIIAQIEHHNHDLKKKKLIYDTAKLEMLPDKGKKLKDSIEQTQEELKKLNTKLQERLDLSQDGSTTRSSTPFGNISNTLESSSNHEMSGIRAQFRLSEEPKKFRISEEPKKNLAFLSKPTVSTDVQNFGKQAQETFETQQALTMDRLKTLHGSLMSQPGENDLAEDPRGLKVELMHHQKQALAWLLWREKQNPAGGILADDMGLGKTLTMISLILSSSQANEDDSDSESDDEFVQKKKNLKYKGGTLVVCPASLIQQWDGEIGKRCKRHLLDVSIFHGNNRETKARRVARLDVVITTYDTLACERKKNSPLFEIDWKRIILDEAHVIRNNKSQKCEAVCELVGKKRWALTGTPIQNKEGDLFSIMKFLKCSPFDDIRIWKRWVDNKNEAGTQRLATVLKSIMLRRTKQELQNLGKIDSLPEKFIETVTVDLSEKERLVYQKLLLYSQTLFAQFLHQQAEKNHINELHAGNYSRQTISMKDTQFNKAQRKLLQMHGGAVKSHEILVLLLRLRQLCNHPSLIKSMLDREDLETNGVTESDGTDIDLLSKLEKMNIEEGEEEEENLNESIGVDKRVVENVLTSDNPLFKPEKRSSKMKIALDIIDKVIEKGEKIVVISQWTSFLDLLAIHFEGKPGHSFESFNGRIPVKKRQEIVENFNKQGKRPNILLLSLTAGGVGLNLVGANNLLVLDNHWNPQLELQAHDRVYRFGQDKQVMIHRLLCKDSIEERIQKLQEKKLEIADNVLLGKNVSSKLSIDDLKMLFSI